MISKVKDIIRFIDNHPLAKKHKVRAYFNLVNWQLSQFLQPREKIVDFIKPTRLLVKKGMTGATGNIYTGLHEFSDMGFLLHFLRSDDLFFDIGANVGTYTVLASGVNKASVVSFEPESSTFESLKANIELNDFKSGIKLLNIGVGAEKSTIKFTTGLDTINHVIANDEITSTHIEIAVESVDDLVMEHGCPALIKIDVEGFETEVVRGMKNTLKHENLKAIIIELNGSSQRYGNDESQIHQCLISNGYFPYVYFPFERRLQKEESFGTLNTIYINDENYVKKRILEAEPFNVFNERI